DVFPACTDDADVLRHLEEYFEDVAVPGPLELGLDAAEHVPFGAKITASVTRRNVLRMAHQRIAGSSPRDALPTPRALWCAGAASDVSYRWRGRRGGGSRHGPRRRRGTDVGPRQPNRR